MPAYVTDTHPVVWYASKNHAKLSRRVLRAFDMAARDEALIYIPAVVLWEIGLLSKLGRIKLREPFDQWVAALLVKPGFQIIPLDAELSFPSTVVVRRPSIGWSMARETWIRDRI